MTPLKILWKNSFRVYCWIFRIKFLRVDKNIFIQTREGALSKYLAIKHLSKTTRAVVSPIWSLDTSIIWFNILTRSIMDSWRRAKLVRRSFTFLAGGEDIFHFYIFLYSLETLFQLFWNQSVILIYSISRYQFSPELLNCNSTFILKWFWSEWIFYETFTILTSFWICYKLLLRGFLQEWEIDLITGCYIFWIFYVAIF